MKPYSQFNAIDQKILPVWVQNHQLLSLRFSQQWNAMDVTLTLTSLGSAETVPNHCVAHAKSGMKLTNFSEIIKLCHEPEALLEHLIAPKSRNHVQNTRIWSLSFIAQTVAYHAV